MNRFAMRYKAFTEPMIQKALADYQTFLKSGKVLADTLFKIDLSGKNILHLD